ncbi:MAG: 4Fe-4S dicluster domain-containing protein [Nitrososphaerota archaeon]|nr:4Fe-4S dicluster domain-containing protein [Candidatus Bathyarchaeota archaeon]MDW8023063.1 4Fe-4S dicluster domain-containing protein [Nitrososphaerota archaeon]
MKREAIWIARDLSKCSGCRKCEIACSLFHEKRIWPEASRIRVFMLVPGVEFPHFCAQCEDYPCVNACPFNALSVSKETGAVLVNADVCTGCGKCVEACPGKVPHMHPKEKRVLICDLCGGDPQCAKVCQEGGWNVLKAVPRRMNPYGLYARTPEEITRSLVVKIYGEEGAKLL